MERVPLSQQKEFRAIHNAVIQAARELPDAQYALGKLLLTDDVEVHDREQGWAA